MKSVRLLAIIFAIASLSFSAGVASTYLATDGVWWGSVPESAKPFAVEGIVDAYEHGWEDGGLYVTTKMAEQLSKNAHAADRSSVSLAILTMGGHALHDGEPKFPQTYAFYEAALTDFYNSHGSVDSVTVGEVVECLAVHPVLSCDDVARSAHSQ